MTQSCLTLIIAEFLTLIGNFTFLITPDEQKRVAALMCFNEGFSRSFDIDSIKEKMSYQYLTITCSTHSSDS